MSLSPNQMVSLSLRLLHRITRHGIVMRAIGFHIDARRALHRIVMRVRTVETYMRHTRREVGHVIVGNLAVLRAVERQHAIATCPADAVVADLGILENGWRIG